MGAEEATAPAAMCEYFTLNHATNTGNEREK